MKNLLKISIIFLLLIFVFYSLSYLRKSILLGSDLYGIWGSMFDGNLVPRPTGLSRTALILLIFYTVVKFDMRDNFWISILIISCISFIALLFSRQLILFLLFI